MVNNPPIGRFLTFSEINCGRSPGYNPVLTQALTVFLVYDPAVGTTRPLIHPVIQILDPFGEVNFHSTDLSHFLI